MSWLSSRRWVANECLKVWQVAGLGKAGGAHCVLYGPLKHGFVEMMAAPLAGNPVHVDAGRREDPLPAPLAAGVCVLARKGSGQFDPAGAPPEIGLVLRATRARGGQPVRP